MDFLENFINKKVGFKFHGRTLQFYLSQSLFSSFDIDQGTRRLLKSIAQEGDLRRVHSLLDIGCGVGVIGICLKKCNPEIVLTVQDRDALALAFTQLNAKLNGIGVVNVAEGLALQGLGDQKFDLIVSNLPGKAGQPVLQDIVARIPQQLTQSGRAAVVIVNPLAELVEHTLLNRGSEILLKAGTTGHAIFHFRKGKAAGRPAEPLSPYTRGTFQFQGAESGYQLRTVYNIAEFDTPGFHTRLAIKSLSQERVAGSVLFWNPGQGHLPVYLSRKMGSEITKYTLAGRDLLSLQTAKLNLSGQGVEAERVTAVHAPTILNVKGQFDFIILFPDADPGVPWPRFLLPACFDLLAPAGKMLLTANSAFAHRLLAHKQGFKINASKKRKGFRACLLEKRAF